MRWLAAAAFLLIAGPVDARAPPEGSADWKIMRDFTGWITSRYGEHGTYCCNLADGRPLNDNEIRVKNGHYEFLFSRAHWPEDGTDAWVSIPDGTILREFNPVGYPIVWAIGYGDQVRVFCAILGSGS